MSTPTRLWLDDLRPPQDDSWEWRKSVEEAIEFVSANQVDDISVDHDLGADEDGNLLPEGRVFILWLAEHGRWPASSISVHSANPPACEYMEGVIQRYSGFLREGQTSRFVRP